MNKIEINEHGERVYVSTITQVSLKTGEPLKVEFRTKGVFGDTSIHVYDEAGEIVYKYMPPDGIEEGAVFTTSSV